MIFALAVHGSRGDVEPFAAIGLELVRRGHEVRMAVPPDMIGFVESVGLSAVCYGPDTQEMLSEDFVHNFWNIQTPFKVVRAANDYLGRVWAEMAATLKSLADGADLLMTGFIQQGLAANVAERYDIPLASVHCFPVRVNGHVVPLLPSALVRFTISAAWRVHWHFLKKPEEVQRRGLGLPKAIAPSTRRIVEREWLDIQAYESFYFPGLAAEWAQQEGRRPFVGALTLGAATEVDDEIASWIAAGTQPIYFGFGSMPVKSPVDMVTMISAACSQLGERALICTGANDSADIPHFDNVKVVRALNHAAVFPSCRAVVHHGGSGTTAAGMRAGVPTLILWVTADQPVWAAQVKRLKVGWARRFSTTTQKSLVADLRTVLAPRVVTHAREIATRMTKPADSVTNSADLLEEAVARNKSAPSGRPATANPLMFGQEPT